MKKEVEKELSFPLKGKYLIMLAPSFVIDFDYPEIIYQLKKLGFSKIVELTFGAKIVNHEYHLFLNKNKELAISSVCPGVVETILSKIPKYKKNLIPVVSPMIAMAKICKKNYPDYKIVFLSPCNFKKIEAKQLGVVDFCVDYREMKRILEEQKMDDIKLKKDYSKNWKFDSFYNEYTKVYPIAGGLFKTAHLRGILAKEEAKVIAGISNVLKFLENEKNLKKIKFLDVNFCKGGCVGGPRIFSKLPLDKRKEKVIAYLKLAESKKIPKYEKGIMNRARGIDFQRKF